MLISLRTLINTTLFRFAIVLWFWFYTKYDPTPAKHLLYTIWRDTLWNIEVTNPPAISSSLNTWTVEYLSNQLIAERLANLEQLCNKSVRLSLYDQEPTPSTNTNNNTIANTITTGTTNIINGKTIPVIDNSNLLRNTTILQ